MKCPYCGSFRAYARVCLECGKELVPPPPNTKRPYTNKGGRGAWPPPKGVRR